MHRAIWLLITCMFVSSTFSASLEDGESAINRNDYATARTIFLAHAQAGNADAQYYLGVMYFNGHGMAIDDDEGRRTRP